MSSAISAPALSSSIRSSLMSSVTSSDQQRKEHLRLNVAAALAQHSQSSDDDVLMRSRQLDFGSADDGDVDDEHEEDTGDSNSSVESQADDVTEGLNARRRGGRRRTVFWSDEEEKLLRRGVKKYGTGKWKQILIDGQDVFSKHRTNVDLKDKWKNMQKTSLTTRKRTAEGSNLIPLVKQEKQPSVHRASRASVKKARSRDNASEVSSVNRARSRTARRAAIAANRAIASVKNADFLPSEEDENCPGEKESGDGSDLKPTGSYDLSEQIVLKFVTDRSFPKLIELRVSFDACMGVSALKKLLRSSILSDVSPDTEVQMIGLKSRQLFDDDELLLQCIKRNGVAFFLVFDDAPKRLREHETVRTRLAF